MKTFSVARAFSAGVDLIERKPWTLAWWALAVIVLELAPRFIVSAVTGGDELGAMRDVYATAFAAHDPAQLRAASDHLKEARAVMGPWGFLWLFWGLFCSAILYNAAYRSVLEPQKSSFGYLRVGVAELWQFLVLCMLFVAVIVFAIVCALVFVAIAAVSHAAGAQAGGWILGVGLVVLVAVIYWLMLRLSLGTVATYAKRRFAYFDSWALTKGRTWKLFWTGFLTLALVIGLYVMFFVSIVFSMVPFAALVSSFHVGPQAAPRPVAAAELLSVGSLVVGVWVVLVSLITAVLHALTLTPWAQAYREMMADDSGGH